MELEEAIEYLEQFMGIKKEYRYKPIKVKTLNNTRQAIETLLHYIKEESIPIAIVKEKIEEYKKILLNLNKFSDVDRIKALNERILVLQEILTKGE